jgi:hypothetical protein
LKGTRHGLQDNSKEKFALRGGLEKDTKQSSTVFSIMQEEDILQGALYNQ